MKFLKIGQLQLTFPKRKNDETYLFFNIFEKYKSQGIIQDFAAHCAMQNERMAGERLKIEKNGKIRRENSTIYYKIFTFDFAT